MEKFVVYIDLPLEIIQKGYQKYFDKSKKPLKRDLAGWIADLAAADILDSASHEEENDDEDENDENK